MVFEGRRFLTRFGYIKDVPLRGKKRQTSWKMWFGGEKKYLLRGYITTMCTIPQHLISYICFDSLGTISIAIDVLFLPSVTLTLLRFGVEGSECH